VENKQIYNSWLLLTQLSIQFQIDLVNGLKLHRVPVLGGGTAIGAGYAAPYMAMEATPAAMYYTQPVTQPASFQPPGLGSSLTMYRAVGGDTVCCLIDATETQDADCV
jgi:hypothetical protein